MENKGLKIIVTALVPKTIAHIGKSGGFVRVLEILKRISQNEGLEIFLLTSDKDYFDHFRKNGIGAEMKLINTRLSFNSLPGLFIKSLFLVFRFILFFPKEKIIGDKNTVFYCSSDLFWETIPAYYCRKKYKNVKWVQIIHHIYPEWKKRLGGRIINCIGYYLQIFSLFLIKKKADRIIAVSYLLKKKLVEIGFSPEKIVVSSNGIDDDYLQKIEKSEEKYDGCYLGRLNHSKGIFDLIEIWKKICKILPEAKLAMIGGGDENIKNELLEKIKNNDLEKNINILGYLKDYKAYPLLKSSKIFLFPSHEEGWGIAVAETMACGLPVVSWNLPVYQEVFENYTIQIEENDIEKFSNEVIKLLTNEELRSKTGLAGKEFIKKYSWDEVAKKELKIIYMK
jgi:glycosyltransferase involved in cell wall biosynthesis